MFEKKNVVVLWTVRLCAIKVTYSSLLVLLVSICRAANTVSMVTEHGQQVALLAAALALPWKPAGSGATIGSGRYPLTFSVPVEVIIADYFAVAGTRLQHAPALQCMIDSGVESNGPNPSGTKWTDMGRLCAKPTLIVGRFRIEGGGQQKCRFFIRHKQ